MRRSTNAGGPASLPRLADGPVRVVHPAVDEWGDGFAVFATPAPTVRCDGAFGAFLIGAAEERLRPVLLSSVGSRVTGFVSLAMRRAGGYWLVQDRDGSTFDAMTGHQVISVNELWGGTPAGRSQWGSFAAPLPRAVGALSFDVHCTRRADNNTLVGVLAETITGALGSAGLDSWGVHEPLLESWDLGEVTRFAQRAMPDAGPILARGPDGSFCEVRVTRRRFGLLENAAGAAPIRPTNNLGALVGLASGMLEQVAEQFNAGVGFCSAVDYDAGMMQSVRARLPEAPLAVLLGPKPVRDMGIDLAWLSATHDVSVFGRSKVPGVVVRFSRPDMGLWAQLVEVVRGVGAERFAAFAGLPAGAFGGPGAD